MIPVIQKEVDEFVEVVWSSHRIRARKDQILPASIPAHIYDFPENYLLKKCGEYNRTL